MKNYIYTLFFLLYGCWGNGSKDIYQSQLDSLKIANMEMKARLEKESEEKAQAQEAERQEAEARQRQKEAQMAAANAQAQRQQAISQAISGTSRLIEEFLNEENRTNYLWKINNRWIKHIGPRIRFSEPDAHELRDYNKIIQTANEALNQTKGMTGPDAGRIEIIERNIYVIEDRLNYLENVANRLDLYHDLRFNLYKMYLEGARENLNKLKAYL